jgi:3'-phosphoadenosine 5'-phosphosulfate sulfotransferase (PAPS reductase)/FAD synthetase
MGKHLSTCLIVNMSGGKDSVRMLGHLCEKYPLVRKIAVIADTGFEHVKPVSAEEWARQRCADFGVELYVVRNPNKTYLEMVEKRGMFPSSSTRQCTSDLKRGPIQTWIRRAVKTGLITEKRIINCMGLRAAESPARAKQPKFKNNAAMSRGKDGKPLTPQAALHGRLVYDWLPIHGESLADVLQWHWDRKVPLHPVYVPEYHRDGTSGGYLRRLSCRVCIFSTKADIHAIYANDREAFDAVSSLERKSGFTMRHGESLVQIVSQPLGSRKQYGSEEAPGCI